MKIKSKLPVIITGTFYTTVGEINLYSAAFAVFSFFRAILSTSGTWEAFFWQTGIYIIGAVIAMVFLRISVSLEYNTEFGDSSKLRAALFKFATLLSISVIWPMLGIISAIISAASIFSLVTLGSSKLVLLSGLDAWMALTIAFAFSFI